MVIFGFVKFPKYIKNTLQVLFNSHLKFKYNVFTNFFDKITLKNKFGF